MKKILYFVCILALLSGCSTVGSAPPQSISSADSIDESHVSLDEALFKSAAYVAEVLVKDAPIIIAVIEAPFLELSDFISSELHEHLSKDGKLEVLERGDALEALNKEHEFQMSGLVSDESAVGIGHYRGARLVITASFKQYAGFNQLRLRVIDMITSKIHAQHSERIRPDDKVLAAVIGNRKDIIAPAITEEALAHLNKGEDFLREGRNDEGIQELSHALNINDNIVEAYLWRGIAYRNKRELDKSIADFTAAIRIDPNNDQAMSNRGVVHGQKGDLDLAIADFTAAIKINPNNDVALNNRGHAYTEKGEHDLAAADFAKARTIQKNPIPTDTITQEEDKEERKARISDYAFRNHFDYLRGYFIWGDGIVGGGGMYVLAGVHWSPVPFLVIGLEGKAGGLKRQDEDDGGAMGGIALLPLGLVIPFNEKIKFFADGLLEIGYFAGMNGKWGKNVAPGFDAGLLWFNDRARGSVGFDLFYKGFWLENHYLHSVGAGMVWYGGSKWKPRRW